MTACKDCRFLQVDECRRFPPIAHRSWPRVESYNWCGEFEAKPCNHEWTTSGMPSMTGIVNETACRKCGAGKMVWYDRPAKS